MPVAPRPLEDGDADTGWRYPDSAGGDSSANQAHQQKVATLRARTTELEAEVARLKEKVSEAEREA